MPSGNTGARNIFLGQSFVQFCGTGGPASTYPAQIGDVAIVNPPTAGYPLYYNYASLNGTAQWVPGPETSGGVFTNTAAAALPTGYKVYNMSPGGYAATLASATILPSGSEVFVQASAAVTLSALTGESISGSSTVAAGATALYVDGGTTWYRVS